jgi:hypothetical protein
MRRGEEGCEAALISRRFAHFAFADASAPFAPLRSGVSRPCAGFRKDSHQSL